MMDSKDANCWICDRPIGQPDELEVFPTSRIAFHLGCLSPRSDQSDTTHDSNSARDRPAAA